MKRTQWIKLLLAVAFTFSITACGSNSSDTNKDNKKESNITATPVFSLDKLSSYGANISSTLVPDHNGHNKAYHFDGTKNNMITIAHNDAFNITKNLTISAWVKIDKKSSGVIVRKSARATSSRNSDPIGCPYELVIAATGHVILSLNLGNNNEKYAWTQLKHNGYQIGEWMHVAGTYDGSSMKLYINGTLEDEQLASGNMSTNSDPLYIGSRKGFATFNGDISDVKIYNKALSDDDIAKLAK